MDPSQTHINPSCHVAYLAIDWGHETNQIHLRQAGGEQELRFAIGADPSSMVEFMRHLRERFPQGRVRILSEQAKGALVNLLVEYDWVDLFSVCPRSAAKFRRSLFPSGAKDDAIDASVLLRMHFTHADRLRPVVKNDEASRRLDALNMHRRDLVEQRVAVALRAKGLLREYYPLALDMVGEELWSPLSLDLLRRWPSHSLLLKAKDETLKRFYYAHRSRSEKAIDKRLDKRRASSPLSSDALLEELGAIRLASCIDQMAVLNKQIRSIEKLVKASFAKHPDRDFFAELPGAGPALAPRLASSFPRNRESFRDASQFQAYVGIAPIKVSSGKKDYTFMRNRCPKFLRQTFHEWAGLTIEYSAWAKASCELQKQRGKRMGAIKRSLAFKWIRILFRCWKNGTKYDEAAYVRSLAKRGSPIIEKMRELGSIDDENNLLLA